MKSQQDSINIFQSVAFKIILVLLTVLFIVLIANSYFFIEKTVESAEKKYQEEFSRYFDLQERLLSLEFNFAENLVKNVAQDPIVIELLSSENEESFESVLDNLKRYNSAKNYDSIYIINAEGTTIVSTEPTFVGKNYSFRDYFKQARSDKVIIYTALGITSNKLGYYFSYPIYSQDDRTEFLGVAVIKLGLSNLDSVLIEKPDTNSYLVDEFGVITFSNNNNHVLQSIGKSDYLDSLVAQQESKYLGQNIPVVGTAEIWKKIQIGSSIVFESNDFLSNTDTVYFSSKVIGSNYYLLMSIEKSKLYSSVIKYQNDSLYNSVLILIIVSFVVLITVLIFLYPFKKLLHYIDMVIEEKEYSLSHIKTYDEFELIVQKVITLKNKFSKDILQRDEEFNNNEKLLEKKIAELEKLNSVMVNRELEIINLKNKLKDSK